MNKRLYYIDNLRGLLIILVVLGHCIQNLDLDFDHNIVFRYIYSFHMPLFMFIHRRRECVPLFRRHERECGRRGKVDRGQPE